MSKGTPVRTFRIADAVHDPAKEKADRLGLTMSEVVRELLVEWVERED